MIIYHKELASGRWFELTLTEQLANVGSEVHRSIKWFKLKDDRFQGAFERALELFDLSLSDNRWRGRRKEIARSREVFCSLLMEPDNYENLDKEFNSLNKYFYYFGIAARKNK